MLESIAVNFKVIVLTETWFRDVNSVQPIDGYDSYHTPHVRGGVSFYFDRSLVTKMMNDISYVNDYIHSCVVRVQGGGDIVYVVAIYRPHSGSINDMWVELHSILNYDELKNKDIIIIGDLNINLLADDDINVTEFLNNMFSFNFLPIITRPTRFPVGDQRGSPSLLDHIWSNRLGRFVSGIVTFDITDHLPTFAIFPNCDNTKNKVKVSFRDHSRQNIELFKRKAETVDWVDDGVGDVDSLTKNFITKLNNLYTSSFPIKTKYLSEKRFKKPWLTPALLQSIKNKSKYFKLYKLGLISHVFYTNYKNKLTSLIRRSKEQYFHSEFSRLKNDVKRTWNVINDLTNKHKNKQTIKSIIINDDIVTDRGEMAEYFNNYFSSIATELDSLIPPTCTDPLLNMNINSVQSFFMIPASYSEIVNIVKKLKNSYYGCHSIPTFIFKLINHYVAEPITCLINLSFSSGKFPDILKTTNITPIYKTGPTSSIENYRPIAILPLLSKIFEKCFGNRLLNFLNKFNFISSCQFGFLKGKSTTDAILKFINNFYDALNRGEHSLGIFIDLKKAFDTVNHEVLFRKLFRYGVRGIALEWIASYLRDRRQRVKIDGVFSNFKVTNISVPQGSVLGPLLFIIYINDLPEISTGPSFTLFADDTSLSIHDTEYVNVINNSNEVLSLLKSWTDANRLTLHPAKTVTLLVTNRKHEIIPTIRCKVDDAPIAFVDNVKFLGLFIDDSLNFKDHIIYISGKIAKSIGIMYSISSLTPIPTLISLYYSLIYPYLTYGNLIWGCTAAVHLDPLLKMQKRAVRIITKSNYLAHTDPLFKQTGILKLHDINCYMTGIHMYKEHARGALMFPSHDYSTRGASCALPAFQRLAQTQRSLSYRGPQIWNAIPDAIKSGNALSIFKKQYKEWLISHY